MLLTSDFRSNPNGREATGRATVSACQKVAISEKLCRLSSTYKLPLAAALCAFIGSRHTRTNLGEPSGHSAGVNALKMNAFSSLFIINSSTGSDNSLLTGFEPPLQQTASAGHPLQSHSHNDFRRVGQSTDACSSRARQRL
jgi:hypothetical protein